jgi:flagellar basal body-associated protein FliL
MPANESDTPNQNLAATKKSGNPLMPLIAVVILVPALVYGVMDFVILPKLKAAAGTAKQADDHSSKTSKTVSALGEHTADFGGLVVNLSGTGSSRYLRTNFKVASADSKIGDIMKENESPLRDAAITILSSQAPSALDNPGGREAVRKQLITKFNSLLGAEVIEQIYFSEFVIQ